MYTRCITEYLILFLINNYRIFELEAEENRKYYCSNAFCQEENYQIMCKHVTTANFTPGSFSYLLELQYGFYTLL